MHYDTTADCDLQAPVKGCCMPKLDSMHGHRDHVTRCNPGLNLKVDQRNYCLGTLDQNWAIFSKNGQGFSRSGQKEFIHKLDPLVDIFKYDRYLRV